MKLGLGELKPTFIRLQLVDTYVKISRCLMEKVFIIVDKFFFPVDFVDLDTQFMRNPSA